MVAWAVAWQHGAAVRSLVQRRGYGPGSGRSSCECEMDAVDEAQRKAQRDEQLAETRRRLPGPGYYLVLRWIHEILRPPNYVEIGVRKGVSLRMALEGTRRIGVDPSPMLHTEYPDTRIFALPSDEFFARHDLDDLLGAKVALAFIDGLHLFEQVLRDFVHLERHSDPATVILLHDCLPFDEPTSRREQTMDFYSGDVWKAALALRRRRPELEMMTVRTAPTGLCMVRGLDAGSRRLEKELPEIVSAYRDLDFDYYSAHRAEMPPEIPSDRRAVGDWLRRRSPVASRERRQDSRIAEAAS
ncbi:MAG: class I SAM-dependent methyltransferase [Solirubrobacterales bacterium]|nr:class I SAM-dependent methyltransferase [Solirubrobacterales bacterium]